MFLDIDKKAQQQVFIDGFTDLLGIKKWEGSFPRRSRQALIHSKATEHT